MNPNEGRPTLHGLTVTAQTPFISSISRMQSRGETPLNTSKLFAHISDSVRKIREIEESTSIKAQKQATEVERLSSQLQMSRQMAKEYRDKLIAANKTFLDSVTRISQYLKIEDPEVKTLLTENEALMISLSSTFVDQSEELTPDEILQSNEMIAKLKARLQQLQIESIQPNSYPPNEEVSRLRDNYKTLKKQYKDLESFIRNESQFERDEAKSKTKALQTEAAETAAALKEVTEGGKQPEKPPGCDTLEKLIGDLTQATEEKEEEASILQKEISRLEGEASEVAKQLAAEESKYSSAISLLTDDS